MENLKETILKFLRLDTLIENITGYLEAKVALVKMEVREEVAGVLSRGLVMMMVAMVGFLFVLFAGLALSLYLNTVLESQFLGYLIVAGGFGLILAILLIGRKSFFKAFEKQFVEMIKHKTH